MNLAELFVKLGLKKEGFDQGMDDAQKKTSSFGSAIAKIGGIIAGAFAVTKIIQFGKDSVQAFTESERAATKLLTALKGNKEMQSALLDQAKELQSKTLYDDDETANAMSLVAAFVKEESLIKRLIPLIQDFASAKNIDLASAANLVGKSVGSSTNALSRYGIEISGAAGSAERAESAIAGLSSKFEGQAEAVAKVATGPLVVLKNAWSDVKEEIGGIILQQANVEGSMTKTATNVFGVLAEKLGAIRGIMKVTGEGFFTALSAYILSSKENVDNLLKAGEKLKTSGVKYGDSGAKTAEQIAAEEEARKKAAEEAERRKQAYIDLLIIQAREEQHINDIIGKRSKDMLDGAKGQSTLTPVAGPQLAGLQTSNWAALILSEEQKKAIQQNNEWVANTEADLVNTLNRILNQGLTDLSISFAEGIGNLMSGDGDFADFGKGILKSVGSFLKMMGAALIAYATAMEAFKKAFTNPWVALAAGVALVAIGTFISNKAQAGPGGSSGGGSYTASGSGAYNSPTQGRADNKVVFEIQGTKLVGVLANTAANKRITG